MNTDRGGERADEYDEDADDGHVEEEVRRPEDARMQAGEEQQLLRAAGSRLSRPKLVACFMHWQKDWDAVQQAIAAKAAQQK